MCGIAGFAGTFDQARLHAMIRDLRHRGPDAEGFHIDEAAGIGLGHARLSILDHAGGAQPMLTADAQLAVAFNGEIYNHRALRKELERLGHVFQSDHSDTEVLLHGYREWGTGLCEHLNGMWAFAIHDRRSGVLFLSRDRFGQKPLYYATSGNAFVFASELAPLVRHGNVGSALSAKGLQKYFGYGFIPAPWTLYDGIWKLPAGHHLTVSLPELRLECRQYWEYIPEPEEKTGKRWEEDCCEALREAIRQAVERRMEADVPLGIFLSGGIDSSSVTAFASAAGNCRGPLMTFSIGFNETSFDESSYAGLVAGRFATDHHTVTVSQETIRNRWENIVKGLDEPMGDSSLLPTYVLCEETRRHVTVALGGDGADELFAGYDPFRALRWADLYQRFLPKPVHRGICLAASCLPVSFSNMSLDFRIRKTLQGLDYPPRLWCPVWMSTIEPRDLAQILRMPVDPEDLYAEAISHWDNCRSPHLVDRTIQFFIKMYLQDSILTKIDRASMFHSLEVRSPYLDIDLVNLVRRIPWHLKLHGGETKHILKRALEPILPHEVIRRPKKGFGVPLAQWFVTWPFTLDHLPGTMVREHIEQRIQAHRRHLRDDRLFLWNTTLLDVYCRENGATAKPIAGPCDQPIDTDGSGTVHGAVSPRASSSGQSDPEGRVPGEPFSPTGAAPGEGMQ